MTTLAAALRLDCKGERIETRRAFRNGAGFLNFHIIDFLWGAGGIVL